VPASGHRRLSEVPGSRRPVRETEEAVDQPSGLENGADAAGICSAQGLASLHSPATCVDSVTAGIEEAVLMVTGRTAILSCRELQ